MRPSEEWGLKEGKVLKCLNALENLDGRLRIATERRKMRQTLVRKIADCQLDGEVAVIECGTDCDGAYGVRRHLIPANLKAFEALTEEIARSAEGSTQLHIVHPWEQIEYV